MTRNRRDRSATRFSYLRVPAPAGMNDCYDSMSRTPIRDRRSPPTPSGFPLALDGRGLEPAPYPDTGPESRGVAGVKKRHPSVSNSQPHLHTLMCRRQPACAIVQPARHARQRERSVYNNSTAAPSQRDSRLRTTRPMDAWPGSERVTQAR